MDKDNDPNDYKTYISDSHSSQSSDESDSGSSSWESEPSSSNSPNDVDENLLEQFLAHQNMSRYTEDMDWGAGGDNNRNYDDENPLDSYHPTDLSKIQVNLVNGRLQVDKKEEMSKSTSKSARNIKDSPYEEKPLTETKSPLGCVLLHISCGKIVLIVILSVFITYLLHSGVLKNFSFNFDSYFPFLTSASEETITPETCDTCEKVSPQIISSRTSGGGDPSLKPELTIPLS